MSPSELNTVHILLLFIILSADPTVTVSMKKDLSRLPVNKTLDLVNVLQRDLRRNNDDYEDPHDLLRTTDANVTNEAWSNDGNSTGNARRKFDGTRHERTTSNEIKSQETNSYHTKTKSLERDTKLHHKRTKSHEFETKTYDKRAKSHEFETKSHLKSTKSHEPVTKSHPEKTKTHENRKSREKTAHDKNMKSHNTKLYEKKFTQDKKSKHENIKSHETKSPDKKPTSFKKARLHDKHTNVENTIRAEKREQHTRTHVQSTTKREFKPETTIHRRHETTPSMHYRHESQRETAASDIDLTDAIGDGRRKRMQFEQLHKLLDKGGLLKKFLKNGPAPSEMRAKSYQPFVVSSEQEIESQMLDTVPSNELDMLPATGEKIETLKRRGRLCHRHVLMPEGPKYDSKGKVYEVAHRDSPVANRSFGSTRQAKQLLPKCCNCCKKSVLGCE